MTDTTLDDYAFAARFRDVIRTIADGEIDSLRPKYTYGKILDIDVVNRKALVVDNGDTDDNAVWRPYGAIAPRAVGQYVRIEGLSSDRFIADVMGEGNLTDPDTIPAPANLVLSTTVDYTLPQVTVTWQAPTSADPFGYQVRWKPASSTNWQYRFVQAPTVTTMLYPLAKDTTYNVEVATIGRSGGISAATVGTITTSHDTTAPIAPTGLTVIAGFEVLEISWNDNNEPDVKFGAGTYRVQVATDAAFASVIRNFVVGATKTTVANLADSTTYYVRIYARDTDGNESLASASVSTTTHAPIVPALTDGAAPSTSPTPTVTGGYGFLAVLWTAITNADPVTYEVHMSTVSGFTPDRTGTTTKYGEVSGTGMIVKKLPDGTALAFGTTYYFKIIAKDADGKGPDSAQGSGTMQQITSGDQVIGTAAISNAMIANLTADKIQTGTMGAQTFTVGTGGVIQSANFVTGSAGWKIDGSGNLEANNAVFRGTLSTSTVTGWLTTSSGGGFRTAVSGPRIEISATNFQYIQFINGGSEIAPSRIEASTNYVSMVSPLYSGQSGITSSVTVQNTSGGLRSVIMSGEFIKLSGVTTPGAEIYHNGYTEFQSGLYISSTLGFAKTWDGMGDTYTNRGMGSYQLQIGYDTTNQQAHFAAISEGIAWRNMRFHAANFYWNLSGGAASMWLSSDGVHLASGLWHRSLGAVGWYNDTYGGGIYMSDTTWVRTYGGKQFYCDSVIRADTRFEGLNGGAPVLVGVSWLSVGFGGGAPNFQNSWANFGSGWQPARFCKDAQGFVHMEGLIVRSAGSSSATIFNLPVGYRPANFQMFPVVANGAVTRLDINPNGDIAVPVFFPSSDAGYVSLSGIIFVAA